jgi:hypothetical protein
LPPSSFSTADRRDQILLIEFDQNDRRFVLAQQVWQSREAACSRVAGDRCVDDAFPIALLLQTARQQIDPAFALCQPVARRDRIADDQQHRS